MTRPTINDVARAAGVSKGTVSFALNDRPGVAPETRRRILATAGELGWTPSLRARALSSSRAHAVGLLVRRPVETLRRDEFFVCFIAGAESVLSPAGFALLLQVVPDQEHEHRSYQRIADEGRVDGVFLTDLTVDDPRPALLDRVGLPAVQIGPDVHEQRGTVVGLDDRPGVVAAVEHLVSLGHTRIAHVSGPARLVHGRSRREAWSATLRAAGLREGPCVEGDFSAASGAAATGELLDLSDPPTAIVFANDLMAMAGMALALARGIRVPEDLSVVGYDDTEMAAHVRPPLTTVSTDAVAWGRAAALRLLEIIRDEPPGLVELPPTRLIVRGSTAPAPCTDRDTRRDDATPPTRATTRRRTS